MFLLKKSKLLIYIFLFSIAISACKKGEDDPFLSLRSRNNRITGKWELVKMNYHKEHSFYQDFSLTSIEDEQFDGEVLKVFYLDYKFDYDLGQFVAKDTAYSMHFLSTLEINKNGKFKAYTEVGSKVTYDENYWHWYDGDKNKIGIYFKEQLYHIKKLKNEEMILVQEKIFEENFSGELYTSDKYLELKFEKK